MSADNAVMESVLRVPAQLARSFAGLTADFGTTYISTYTHIQFCL